MEEGNREEGMLSHVGYSLLAPSATRTEDDAVTGGNDLGTASQCSQAANFTPSLLQTVSEHLESRHLLLHGPPNSGRSSLLMDLACAFAASTACRCMEDSRGSQCSCTAVTLFRPVTPDNEDDRFPMHCFPSKTSASDNHQLHPSNRDTNSSFSRSLLRRIQIRWIASFRDLLEQLLVLQGSPFADTPSALLLDDLEQLCTRELPSHASCDGSKMRLRKSLAMATAIDTANCLTAMQQRRGFGDGTFQPVLVLAVSTIPESLPSTTLSNPSNALSYLPLALGFGHGSSSHWKQLVIIPDSIHTRSPAPGNDEVVVSRWILQQDAKNHSSSCSSKSSNIMASYTILQSLERGWRLQWETTIGEHENTSNKRS